MSAVSLRLPDHLEQQISEEARLSGQPRSQLLREALETLLSQRREERAQAALRLAAEALASDAGACAEARELAADFLMAENEALRLLIPARDRLLASAGPWRSKPEPSIATASATAPCPGSALLK